MKAQLLHQMLNKVYNLVFHLFPPQAKRGRPAQRSRVSRFAVMHYLNALRLLTSKGVLRTRLHFVRRPSSLRGKRVKILDFFLNIIVSIKKMIQFGTKYER
jgi:hypothetical protein